MSPLLLLVLQVAGGDSLPTVTLADALQRSAQFDTNYVAALGRVETAARGRRAAMLTFLVPAVSVQAGHLHFHLHVRQGHAHRLHVHRRRTDRHFRRLCRGSMTSKYIPDIWLKRLFVLLAIYVGVGYTTKGFLGYSVFPGM